MKYIYKNPTTKETLELNDTTESSMVQSVIKLGFELEQSIPETEDDEKFLELKFASIF